LITRDDLTLEDLEQSAEGAAEDAILELHQAGIAVVYREDGLHVLEQPDGQRFEIEFDPLKLKEYRVIRTLQPTHAWQSRDPHVRRDW
jgi:hypothetical protein